MGRGVRITGVAVVTALVVIALAVVLFYTYSRPNTLVALGTPIQQDDFIYVVNAVGRSSKISNKVASATADGIFYIVTIRVDNDAKRASFTWDERIPHIVDADGHRYDDSPEGQAALDAAGKPDFVILPGSSASFQAVFDVPTDIRRPVLALDNGILMGDLFNLVAYRRVGVTLY